MECKKYVIASFPSTIRKGVEKVANKITEFLEINTSHDFSQQIATFIITFLFGIALFILLYRTFQMLGCEGIEKLKTQYLFNTQPTKWTSIGYLLVIIFTLWLYFIILLFEITLKNGMILLTSSSFGGLKKWIPTEFLTVQQLALTIYVLYNRWSLQHPLCEVEVAKNFIQDNLWILGAPSLLNVVQELWEIIQPRPKDSMTSSQKKDQVVQWLLDLFLPLFLYTIFVGGLDSSCSVEFKVLYTTILFTIYILINQFIQNFSSLRQLFRPRLKMISVQTSHQVDFFTKEIKKPFAISNIIQIIQIIQITDECEREEREKLIQIIQQLGADFENITNFGILTQLQSQSFNSLPNDLKVALIQTKNYIFPERHVLEDVVKDVVKDVHELKLIMWRAYLVYRQTLWNTNLFWKITIANRVDRVDMTNKVNRTKKEELPFDINNKEERNAWFEEHTLLKKCYWDPQDLSFREKQKYIQNIMQDKINYSHLKSLLNPELIGYLNNSLYNIFDELQGIYYELMVKLYNQTVSEEMEFEFSKTSSTPTKNSPRGLHFVSSVAPRIIRKKQKQQQQQKEQQQQTTLEGKSLLTLFAQQQQQQIRNPKIPEIPKIPKIPIIEKVMRFFLLVLFSLFIFWVSQMVQVYLKNKNKNCDTATLSLGNTLLLFLATVLLSNFTFHSIHVIALYRKEEDTEIDIGL